jgi:hypothetical protein
MQEHPLAGFLLQGAMDIRTDEDAEICYSSFSSFSYFRFFSLFLSFLRVREYKLVKGCVNFNTWATGAWHLIRNP